MAGFNPDFNPALNCFPSFSFSKMQVKLDSDYTGFSPSQEVLTVWCNYYSDEIWRNQDVGLDCEQIAENRAIRNTIAIPQARNNMTLGMLGGVDFMYPTDYLFTPDIEYTLPAAPAAGNTGDAVMGYTWVQATNYTDIATWKVKGVSGINVGFENGQIWLNEYLNDEINIKYSDGDLFLIPQNGVPIGGNRGRIVLTFDMFILENIKPDWDCCIKSGCCTLAPNPNNSIVSTVQPGDLSWHEKWGLTMPPAETKQPLANHSRPLNILNFLK